MQTKLDDKLNAQKLTYKATTLIHIRVKSICLIAEICLRYAYNAS